MSKEPSRLYQELAAALARLDDPAGGTALEKLLEHPDEDARRRALGGLVAIRRAKGESAVDLLRRGFEDRIAEVREAALELYRGEEELIPDLARLVGDRAGAVRGEASRLVRRAKSSDPVALAPVFTLLADATADLSNRIRAVQALGYPCGCDEHRQALVKALTDPEEGLRVNTSRTLRQVAPDAVLSARLREIFPTVEGEVRTSVAWGLAALGDPASQALFLEWLEVPELQRPAVSGLRRLGSVEALPGLRKLWESVSE